MKPIPRLLCTALLLGPAALAPASTLMLDFGPTIAAGASLTLSPGHSTGTVTASETSWNTVTTSAQVTSLNWSDGTGASGVTLTMGTGLKSSSTITYSNTASFSGSITGNGGSAVIGSTTYEKLTTNKGTSIYGPASGSTTIPLDALFSSVNDTSIGFRVDGLTVGDYLVYVMARNTNTNAPTGAGMNVYATTGTSATSFNYSALTAAAESNPGYASGATYVNQYGSFIAGENYVAIPVTVASGQSLFVSSEGQGTGGAGRGFINMIQIVAVPEPSAAALGAFGLLALLRRRRA